MIVVSIGRGRHKIMSSEYHHRAEAGADLVELRLDYLVRAVNLKPLLAERPCPIVVTCRPALDGGHGAKSETARLMLRPLRRDKFYGYYLLLISSGLVFLADLLLEPYASQVAGWWSWPQSEPVAKAGLFWGVGVAWLLSAAFILMLATPWLLPKRPIPTTPTLHSPAIWLALLAWFTGGDLRHGFFVAGAIGLVTLGVVGGLTWSGYQIGLEAVTRRHPPDDEAADE